MDRIVTLLAAGLTLILLAVAFWPVSAENAPGIVLFLGRFHPLLVHLPIGFLLALVVLELVDLVTRNAAVQSATRVLAWLGAGAAVLAVVAGGLLAYPNQYSEELLFRHRWLGIFTAVAAVWIVAWKLCRPRKERHGWSFVYHPLMLITVILLGGAGHYGGALTHGSDYLTAHMPNPLRAVLGLPERVPPAPLAIPDDPRESMVFATLVQPILENNCVGCHGAERQREGLRLDSYEWLIQGGNSGADPSLIVESLHLPMEDDRHMPPSDKPQLSSDEISLIEWWVNAGAEKEARVQDLETTAQIDRILADTLGIESVRIELPPMKPWEEIADTVAELNRDLRLGLQRKAQKSSSLELPYLPMDAAFGDEELARLAPLRDNVETLNLGRSQITDAGLAHVGEMKNLVWLDLSNTAVTDAGLEHLSGLPLLHYLNLYGTAISDNGLKHLSGMPNLRRVYVWQTQATPEGVANLRASLVDEGQVEIWRARIRSLEEQIAAARVEVDLGRVQVIEAAATEEAPAPVNQECPVSGKPVDATKTAEHGDALIAFCCEKCLKKFQDDPNPILAKLKLKALPK